MSQVLPVYIVECLSPHVHLIAIKWYNYFAVLTYFVDCGYTCRQKREWMNGWGLRARLIYILLVTQWYSCWSSGKLPVWSLHNDRFLLPTCDWPGKGQSDSHKESLIAEPCRWRWRDLYNLDPHLKLLLQVVESQIFVKLKIYHLFTSLEPKSSQETETILSDRAWIWDSIYLDTLANY